MLPLKDNVDEALEKYEAIKSVIVFKRTGQHINMVTGPVSIPFTGLSVRDCAYLIQSTVIAFGRDTSPKMIGGRT